MKKKILYYLGVLFQVGGPLLAMDYRHSGALTWLFALGGFSVGTAILAAIGEFPGMRGVKGRNEDGSAKMGD